MRIFLVRHGQSEANIEWAENARNADAAISLTEKGKTQARAAGDFLADYFHKEAGRSYPKIRLWHSPYLRAEQTADEIVKTARSIPCEGTNRESRKIVDTRGVARVVAPGDSIFWDKKMQFLLYEQAHGVMDGMTDKERAREFPAEWAYYQKHKAKGVKILAQLPLGESRIQVATRIQQSFGKFHRDAEKHGIDNIVVVAHGTTNRCFAFAWMQKPLSWLETEPNPKNCSIRLIKGSTDQGYIFDGFEGGVHQGQ